LNYSRKSGKIKVILNNSTPNMSFAKKVEKKMKYPHAGHRSRLRKRFLLSGFEGFLDYEIVELLLTLGTPRKDCKAMAKEAIKEFRGLRGVLDASLKELEKIKGIGPSNAFGVKLFQEVSARLAREELPKKITLDSARAVAEYLQRSIGGKKKEHFVVLYLDARNRLIYEETTSVGTLNANLVHPREVFKPAIERSAAGIIVAHNHPSGGAEPSAADIELTKRLKEAGRLIGIEIIDHLVITKNGFSQIRV
jgi:DNA repair protein RadC